MKFVMLSVVVFYLIMAQSFFKTWLKFLHRDTDMSPEEKQLSWVILLVSTVLWPLIVPIAYLSLLEQKFKNQAETIEQDEPIESAYSLPKRIYPDKFVSLESFYSTFHILIWQNWFFGNR